MDYPKTIICDCDGVLTDGKLYMDHTGEKMFKAFHSHDVRAIRELVANGFRFIIVTADDSEITKRFAEKTGAELMVLRDKSKIEINEPYIGIGDDVWDVPFLKKAQIAYYPIGSDASVLAISNTRYLNKRPGQGVIAHLVNILKKHL